MLNSVKSTTTCSSYLLYRTITNSTLLMLVAMGIIISLGLLMFMDQIKRYPASAC